MSLQQDERKMSGRRLIAGATTFAALSVLSLFILHCAGAQVNAQPRVAVLPFNNMHGDFAYTEPCYDIADSLARMLQTLHEQGKIHLVPSDSVQDVLASLNVDPSNAQYVSDMWKAVSILKVDKVLTGGFNVRFEKIFINAYIYDVKTKLAQPKYQARDIFKKYDKALEAVRIIYKKLSPYFLK